MIEGCAKDKANNVAAVNLKKLPHRTATERFTGEAVDAGYPSQLTFFSSPFLDGSFFLFLGERNRGAWCLRGWFWTVLMGFLGG